MLYRPDTTHYSLTLTHHAPHLLIYSLTHSLTHTHYSLALLFYRPTLPVTRDPRDMTGWDYDRVMRNNFTPEDLCAIADIVSMIKRLGAPLSPPPPLSPPHSHPIPLSSHPHSHSIPSHPPPPPPAPLDTPDITLTHFF